MPSIFTKIVQGEIPCYKIAETDNCYAFLDVSPLTKGHTLVVPKKETNKIFDVPQDVYTELMELAYEIGTALEKTMDCVRVGMAVLGMEVPHAHVHVVPLHSEKDLNFSNSRKALTQEEFEQVAKQITQELKKK